MSTDPHSDSRDIHYKHDLLAGFSVDYTITRDDAAGGYLIITVVSHPDVTTTHMDGIFIPDELMTLLATLPASAPAPASPPDPENRSSLAYPHE